MLALVEALASITVQLAKLAASVILSVSGKVLSAFPTMAISTIADNVSNFFIIDSIDYLIVRIEISV